MHSPKGFPLRLRKDSRAFNVIYIGKNYAHEEGYKHSKDNRDLRVHSESGAELFRCELPDVGWN